METSKVDATLNKSREINQRRLKLSQSLILISGAIALVWAILMFILRMDLLGVFVSISVIGFVGAYFLLIFNKNLSGRILYLITGNLIITVLASFAGRSGGIEFLLAFAIGLPFLLFSWKRERPFIFIFPFFTFLLWVGLMITDFNLFTQQKIDSQITKQIIYPFSVISTFVLTIFQTSYFLYLNALFEGELKQKRLEALESLAAKAKFLSTMSHEIRTPLNAVVGLSYLLKDSNPKPDQIDNIEALNYSGKSLLTLINDVLDFNKMEGEHVELESISTDLKIIAKQIAKIHEPLCIKKGITFKIDIDDSIGSVLMDPARMNQVLNNLISNAIKFTDAGGVTLKITTLSETDDTCSLKFEIIDTGIGISEDNFLKIFETFSQANTNTSRLYGGTGLGLPIVKKIIHMMKSEIKLESVENEGSIFYFTLDLTKASEEEKNDIKKLEMVPFHGEKILLVEDNEINVMVGRQILCRWNLIIEVAQDGKEAVDMVKKDNYDVVLMDIQIPVMNGYDASKEIRTFNKDIPIIALSASVFVEVKDKIFESGMNGFIYKPFDPIELYSKVASFINKSDL
jgi:signal transduction histidine kinase/CheY-like chemotaxis protein